MHAQKVFFIGWLHRGSGATHRPSRGGWFELPRVLVLVLCLLVAGCSSTPVAHDLTQTQANQIVSLLNQHGIGAIANRESGGRGRFTVHVKRDHYAQAVALMTEKGLPGEHELSFAELVAGQGLLPASREMEALKLDHAIAAEIEELLREHPSVTTARAVVRLNAVKDPADTAVSLVIQEKSGESIDKLEMVEIVSRAVPGIAKEKVFVSTHKSPSSEIFTSDEGVMRSDGRVLRVPLVPFLLAWRVPTEDYNTLAFAIIACFMVIGMIGGVIGYYYGYSQHGKSVMGGDLPDLKPRTLKLDGVRIDKGRRDLPEN